MVEAEPARGYIAAAMNLADVMVTPGALRTMFQPIVRCRDGSWSLHALECLTRGPSDSPYAEAAVLFAATRACHLEARMDRACVTTALETAAHCGIKSPLFVNVSPITLMSDESFPDFLATTAAGNGVDWRRVTVEVIEQERDCDAQALIPALRSLRELGVHVALDDFGSTKTDARPIESCPCRPDLVKLDGRLFRDAGRKASTRQRLLTVVEQVRRSGLEVVAEGVETDCDLQLAAHFGIELVQGFHVCRPLAGEFAARAESLIGLAASA
jgi:EAL domain-containing protein (putative c-di-GMP-specific phosphodiesterase class I)